MILSFVSLASASAGHWACFDISWGLATAYGLGAGLVVGSAVFGLSRSLLLAILSLVATLLIALLARGIQWLLC